MFAIAVIANLITTISVLRTVLKSLNNINGSPAMNTQPLHREEDRIVYNRISTVEFD